MRRRETDGSTAPVEETADHYPVCEQARVGSRFSGDEFETLVYPIGRGAYYQTTIACWRQVIGCVPDNWGEPASPTGSTRTDEDVGRGATIDGAATARRGNPAGIDSHRIFLYCGSI